MPRIHHMLDLETLDTAPSALVLSIGIAAFDADTFEIAGTYYAVLEHDQQGDARRTKSVDTLNWWAKQNDAARKVFVEPRTDVIAVLDQVERFVDGSEGVWGNGASFDNVILADLFRSFNEKAPWPFWLDRCHRTIRSAANGFDEPAFVGTPHNALHDAVHQVCVLKAACKYLNLEIR